MPIDPSIALSYKFPQIEGPLDQYGKAAGLAGLLRQAEMQKIQMQEAQQQKVMREEYRSGLTPGMTNEQQLAHALRFMGPKEAATLLQGEANKKIQAESNKQIALARLQQTASQFEASHALRLRQATTAEERAAEIARHDRVKEQLDAYAARVAGERLHWDTGVSIPPPAAAPTAAPTGLPSYQDALSKFPAGSPLTVEYNPQTAPTPPTLTPTPAAAAPSANVPSPQFADGNTPTNAPAPPVSGMSPRDRSRLAFEQEKLKTQLGSARAPDEVVNAIIEGRMQVPGGFALRSPYWQDVIARVSEKDPKFDATKFGARQAARRTFASGPEARNVTAINTVIGHLGTLDEMATALENGDVRIINSVVNRARTELGDPRVQNFDTAKQAVAEETMRVFRQVGASEAEAKAWGERITSSGSPTQLRGVIRTLGDLLDSRIQAISAQYERTVNEGRNPASVEPRNIDVLNRLRGVGQPYNDPDKERRYQEWKARQGG